MKENSLKRPVIALMVMSAIGVATPLAVGAYYNYNDYVDLAPQLATSLTAIPHNVVTSEPMAAPEVVPEATPKVNKKIERITVPETIIVVGPSKAKPVPKKLVCSSPRKLIQGSGTVRACEWQ
jgi:hypothetical protein